MLKSTQKALTDEQKKKAEGHLKRCMDKIGVSKEDVVKVRDGDFSVEDKRIEVRTVTRY